MAIEVVDVVWNDFLTRFMGGEFIYVTEEEDRYILKTNDNHFFIRTVYPKSPDYTENISFITRYLSQRNIIWTTSFEEEIIDEEPLDEDDIGELESSDSEGQFE